MLPPPIPSNAAEFDQVLQFTQRIVDHPHQRQKLVETKGDTAQEWLDLLQLLTEYPNVPISLRSSISTLMIRLSRKSGLYPQCLTIRGVEKLGKYPVGGGAFGDVWKGKLDQRLVCLKVIRVFHQSDVEQTLKDYMQEGIVWRQLDHPNILPFMGIYYLDVEQKQLCLVSPWMERGNLVEFLKNSEGPVDRMVLAYDVACGLAHLHEKNIVHGDLKGVNILITPDLRACIADFGLSRVSATQLLLSETIRSKGTTRWLSPELLTPGLSSVPSKQSDVYAYACVCYEIFTNRIPFYELAEAMIVIAVYINKQRPSRPRDCQQLCDSMWYLMEACWNETPSLRPTMTDILARIHQVNPDRRLEPATNWRKATLTQVWNDADHPILMKGESLFLAQHAQSSIAFKTPQTSRLTTTSEHGHDEFDPGTESANRDVLVRADEIAKKKKKVKRHKCKACDKVFYRPISFRSHVPVTRARAKFVTKYKKIRKMSTNVEYQFLH